MKKISWIFLETLNGRLEYLPEKLHLSGYSWTYKSPALIPFQNATRTLPLFDTLTSYCSHSELEGVGFPNNLPPLTHQGLTTMSPLQSKIVLLVYDQLNVQLVHHFSITKSPTVRTALLRKGTVKSITREWWDLGEHGDWRSDETHRLSCTSGHVLRDQVTQTAQGYT